MVARTATRLRTPLQVALGFALTLLFFFVIAPFVIPVLLGAILTILVYPIYERIPKTIPRGAAALLVTTAVTLLVLFPFVGGFVMGVYQIRAWLGDFTINAEFLSQITHAPVWTSASDWLGQYVPINRQWIQSNALTLLGTIVERLSQLLGSAAAGIPMFLLGFVVVILSVFFLILDGKSLLLFLNSLSPLPSNRTRELYLSFESSCRGVVLGMLASSAAQGALVFFFFFVCGVPHAALWGFVSVFMGMVPVVGVGPITVGGIIFLILNGQYASAAVLVFGSIVVSTADNVVRPLVMRGHSEMHPLLALTSGLGAVIWLGATGIFLGPIIAAVFVSFLKIVAVELSPNSKN